MSYLSRPQINFMGTAYCNPSTGDNNDFADIFDVDTLQLKPIMTVIQNPPSQPQVTVIQPPGQQTFPYSGPADASDARTWIMGLMDNVTDGGPYGQQAHWNYYGDHGTRLDNTVIKSIQARPGVTVPPNDPLYSATVNLIGTPSPMQFQDPVIVDNDPYALITSQIFSYGITVTGKDASGNPVTMITANPTSRAYAYYINGFKNLDPNAIGFQGVSAIFLCSVPSGPNIQINTSLNSPALTDLAAAVASGAGLQLRFIFYDAIYQIDPKTLHDNFAAGNYTPNPYIGLTLGSLGVLAPGEMLSAPPNRKLGIQSPFYFDPNAVCGPPATVPNPQNTKKLGITLANLDLVNEVASLDCVSTFPECNVKSNTKFSLGPMTLDLLNNNGGRITLGTIPYDQTTYETYAGLVEIPLSNHPQLAEIKAAVASSFLAIHSTNLNADLLTESTGLDIQTEDRAIYFDAQTLTNWNDPSEQPVAGTAQVTIRVFLQDQPVQNEVQVNLEYWMCDKSQINPSKPQVNVPSRYFTVAGATQLADTVYPDPNNPNGTINVITDQVTIPANSNGTLTLNLTALRPGTSLIRFVDPTLPQVTPGFVWDNCSYSCVRILPFDDYRAIPDSQIDEWSYIYANFFNYFALLYPIMSRVIPWGPLDAPNNPDTVKQFASNLRSFTNPINWNSTIYMPITRDLSAGKRALLWRWCALQGG